MRILQEDAKEDALANIVCRHIVNCLALNCAYGKMQVQDGGHCAEDDFAGETKTKIKAKTKTNLIEIGAN
jgi:hypothetical protein